VGGTPLGKRAITLDASKLTGSVHELKVGDHVDVMASVQINMPGAARSLGNRMGSVIASPETGLLPKRSLIRSLAQDAIVVAPVRIRNVPIGMAPNGGPRMVPREEIVLAVGPEEVAPLLEAFDMNYEVMCVARSGQPAEMRPVSLQTSTAASPAEPDEHNLAQTEAGSSPSSASEEDAAKPKTADDVTPGYDPVSDTSFMELLVGTNRQFVVFAGPGRSPVVRAEAGGSGSAAESSQPATPDNQRGVQ
jgi:hypothetical protein